ncbi:hypothetical protein LINGRAHAP2_LOCUS14119 [Linum grandiflorum]
MQPILTMRHYPARNSCKYRPSRNGTNRVPEKGDVPYWFGGSTIAGRGYVRNM